MNRPIKFRVWRFCVSKNAFKFYYTSGPFITREGGATLVFPTDGNEEYFDAGIKEPAEHIVIQQFTGLTDKNGREIYEGDIISMMDSGKHEVFFRDGSFMYWIDRESYLELSQSGFIGYLEVLGNILENPEILQKDRNLA